MMKRTSKKPAKSKKTTKSSQKKKKTSFFLRHPLILPVTVFFVVTFLGLSLFVAAGATTNGAADKRIVNLYVDDEKQTLSTRAKTVEEFLERAEVDLIDEDIVEPARDTEILEDNPQINVYRARSVEVIDGDRTITILSAQRAPRLLAAEAGVELFPEDVVSYSRNDQSVLVSSAGEQLVISRSTPVKVNVYGVVTAKRTTATTVQEYLDQNGIVVEEGSTLQPADPNAPITPNLLIAVNKIGIKTDSVTEPVPYPTETREDANLEVGQRRVERAGADGERTVVYEITEQDGVEVKRRELQAIITRDPVAEIVVRGTKPATLSSSVSVSADKIALMAAAGIAESDYAYVDYIIQKESNWRPGARNSSSGAYGLCQSLPASKMASAGPDYLTNPVTQLRWCSGYAAGRYGGWQNAYNAWLVQRWW